MASIIAVQLVLAVILFFIVNWVGQHSASSGYLSLSLFAKTDEAPAFNFLFRVAGPIVYLILTASVLYALRLDSLVRAFYMVAVYYVLFRWSFNLVTGRARLLNWRSQVIVGLATCSIAYFLYEQVLSKRHSLLPDFSSVGNELWIIVLVFLYQAANKITLSPVATVRRKRNYLERRFQTLKNQYDRIIHSEAGQLRPIVALAYAVLIYETFNRPGIYRWMESKILFPLGLAKTLGPMQVETVQRIDDYESVRLGVRKLREDYLAVGGTPDGPPYHLYEYITKTLKRYNVRSDYPAEVYQLYSQIADLIAEEQNRQERAASAHLGAQATP